MVEIAKRNKVGFTFTKQQLVRLFDALNIPKVMIGVFIARMIGLRLEEVCRLKWENIDTKSRVVAVLDSKWRHRERDGYGKDRFVRLPETAVGPIERWREIIGGGTWFLPSDKSPDLHMRKKTLYEQFRHAMRLAGLDEAHFEFARRSRIAGKVEVEHVKRRKLNFHSLRAYWVVDCRKRGIPLEIIAEQAGHVDINTTKGYARYSDEEKNRILDRAYGRTLPEIEAEAYSVVSAPAPAMPREDGISLHFKPREFLQMQLLRGQISKEEYLEKMKLLSMG